MAPDHLRDEVNSNMIQAFFQSASGNPGTRKNMVSPEKIESTLRTFILWLEMFGETSYDHQTFFSSQLGRRAKTLYYNSPLIGIFAVAPFIFCEAFLPAARRLFWKRQRLAISDAHYAMGFAYLAQATGEKEYLRRAYHFLNVLVETRSPGFDRYCWGESFDWVTRNGTIPAGTPLITATPYVYEAFLQVYQIDGNKKWLDILRSIAEHAEKDIKDFETGPGTCSCSYTPYDNGGVINASAYRSFLLTSASSLFKEERYNEISRKNLNFVLQNQLPDGSWPYAVDGVRDFIDHFHTCFVLKALVKIEKQKGYPGCRSAIERGIDYYIRNLFDDKGLPRPFSKPPRITVYRHELYDYAECINLGVLLKGRFPQLDRIVNNVLFDLLTRWQKADGSFRSRKLIFGWDNVPMHRWAQSQLFRSLCFLLNESKQVTDKGLEENRVRNLRPV
jgi:hypothetical protein